MGFMCRTGDKGLGRVAGVEWFEASPVVLSAAGLSGGWASGARPAPGVSCAHAPGPRGRKVMMLLSRPTLVSVRRAEAPLALFAE
jgi:hypothetical protein